MTYYLVTTIEILLAIVTPLVLMYLRSAWPLRTYTPCLVVIPVLWYPVYAPIHELSHAAATWMVGGRVTSMKLIPSFWRGEFGRAWITTEGVMEPWRQLFTTAAPYVLDLICIAAGLSILQRSFSRNPFVVGLLFMLLCLRPAFDFFCEAVGLLMGDKGDFYAIQSITGNSLIWFLIVLSLGLSVLSILMILKRFVGFPERPPVEPGR